MTTTLRLVLFCGIILFFIIIVYLLKKNRLALRYTLMWMGMGLCMLLLVIFPQILGWLRDLLGFEDSMNALYVCGIGFAFILLMALTSIVSRQSDRIKSLTQENAILEKRIRKLEQGNEQDR